uniref:Uncharacterized protein n=1 Tax=Arundo donax TaxID=35708 RepID=A0A0A9A7Q4_ARUDO
MRRQDANLHNSAQTLEDCSTRFLTAGFTPPSPPLT